MTDASLLADPLERLLERLFDPGLEPEEMAELRRLLATSQAARQRYVLWVNLHSTLTWEIGRADAPLWILDLEEERTDRNVLDETMVLPALREDMEENHSPAIDPAHPPFWLAPRKQAAARRRKPGWRTHPWRIAAMIVVLVLSAAVVALFQSSAAKIDKPAPQTVAVKPAEPPVWAHVTKQIGAVWGSAGAPEGTALRGTGPFTLTAGYAEICFGSGARLVLEGPAEFVLDGASEMAVKSGRLSATVEGGGFVVQTPSARVTDLGTEFGVAVGADQKTEVAVFKGKVETALSAAAHPQNQHQQSPSPLILAVGQAAIVSTNKIQADQSGANVQKYVRSLSGELTALDVVDLIAGGDGTTHRRGVAIDPTTGNAGALKPAEMYTGDHRYHRVASVVVDGCFVPDDSKLPEVVDSAGHTYAFPATANGGFNHIWTGGTIPDVREIMPTLLGQTDYGKPDHALLSMHSNKGLTLNLGAIRRLHPGVKLTRLRSVVGNTHVDAAPETWRPVAEAWVLVDGAPRYASGKFTAANGAMVVDVAVDDNDQFLTFAVTDGDGATTYDWILWGDPHFDVIAR